MFHKTYMVVKKIIFGKWHEKWYTWICQNMLHVSDIQSWTS
jgi:hypothetical protein